MVIEAVILNSQFRSYLRWSLKLKSVATTAEPAPVLLGAHLIPVRRQQHRGGQLLGSESTTVFQQLN